MASHHRLGQPFKIFCRADEDYCLTVRDDLVVLAPANPMDEYQVQEHFLIVISHSRYMQGSD